MTGLNNSSWIGKAISIAIVILVVFIGSKQVARAQTAIIAFGLIILIAFIGFGLAQAHVPLITTADKGNGIIGIFLLLVYFM